MKTAVSIFLIEITLIRYSISILYRLQIILFSGHIGSAFKETGSNCEVKHAQITHVNNTWTFSPLKFHSRSQILRSFRFPTRNERLWTNLGATIFWLDNTTMETNRKWNWRIPEARTHGSDQLDSPRVSRFVMLTIINGGSGNENY
jgi:hypothetical protein